MRILSGNGEPMNRVGTRWITALIAMAGTASCVAALVHFLQTILYNRLPEPGEHALRDHYLAVGHSYSQGFVVGFFLCFSLAILAATVAGWREGHRLARAGRSD
jgi:hypothetical protein